ncbi:CRISPR-associated endonuclease Cas1 [Methanimicrococcus hongohii]|uniref:CRISPR-associated endonuclease Cas1 n=1 Tax=Methanimicrococcus hongohii TaxID=3028295 RepID=A0AA96ZTV7_9EURY|nr:type II CRISPR-associated endonuclease Cas1 [Methanimicrococcus sp. Hf6]WNY23122.1 CRISPR-associated endonuclease Cas1 [Methanimicrococcus sp. Hf6]
MTWRIVVISSVCKLDLKLNHIVIRGEQLRRVHLSEIAVLMIENTSVSLTAALLCELSKRKIKVIFCDEKRNPYGELLPFYGSHDTTDKLRTQIGWDLETAGIVWAEIVKDKIRKQAGLLSEYRLNRQAELLESYIDEVQPHDSTNREGHAAKVYFNALYGMDFSRRNENTANACMNYGYAVLLSAFNREITAAGYFTQLGIFHDNTFNPFNLGSDLMEPFRPLIDKCVLEMDPIELGTVEKMKLVEVLNWEVVIDSKNNYLINAIRIYCRSVFDAMNTKKPEKLRFYG